MSTRQANKSMPKYSKKPRSGKPTVGNTNTTVEDKLRARSWSWTLNNYSEDEYDNITQLHTTNLKKWIIGKEVGKEGTPHLQGYFQFAEAVSFKTVKRILPRAHIEKSKGTPGQNYIYCSKERNFICGGFDEQKRKVWHMMDLLDIEEQDFVLEDAIEWEERQKKVDEEPYISMDSLPDSVSDSESV